MIKLKTLILEANKIANGTAFTLTNRDPWNLTEQFKFTDKQKQLLSTKPVDVKPVEKEKADQKSTTKSDKSPTSTNIIIGDSQTGLVSKNSSKVQLINKLYVPGKGVGWLRDLVAAYPVSPNVNNVVLCIGVNGGYFSNGSAEKGLFTALRKTFPNAKIYAVQGSWAWGSYLKKPVTEKQVRTYYKNYYQDNGAILIEPPIGPGDPHGNKPVYKLIGAEIDAKLN